MIKKLHTWYSFLLWTLWAVGLGATALSRFQYLHENDRLFWDFVLPYNEIIQILSYVPVAPILFLIALAENKKENKKGWPTILLFLFTAAYWVAYITCFIRWTEG